MKKILSPKLDIVFHMLFGEQKHERITKKLVEDVIGEKVETIELEQTPYLWGEQVNDKVGIIDIRAKINNKNPIDIEMQIVDNHDIEKRLLFYWSKLYLKQIERGEDYEKLNRSISIIFLDYKIEKLKELPIHTKWQIKESENGGIRNSYNRATQDKRKDRRRKPKKVDIILGESWRGGNEENGREWKRNKRSNRNIRRNK